MTSRIFFPQGNNLGISNIMEPIIHNIHNQILADMYIDDYVDYLKSYNEEITYQELYDIARENIGYYAGYYSKKDRERIEKLFYCIHPVLGPVTGKQLTSEEIFNIGLEMGKTGKYKANYKQPEKVYDKF